MDLKNLESFEIVLYLSEEEIEELLEKVKENFTQWAI